MGALPALYVFVIRRSLPESPRYLVSRGRYAEAKAVVAEMERASGVVSSARTEQALSTTPPKKASVRELFSGRYARRTATLWIAWITMNLSYYGIFLWLPTQFTRKGFSLEEALLFNLLIALAQIPGYFSAAGLVERWGRKKTLLAFLMAAAVGAIFFGQVALVAKDVPQILFWGSVISFFNLGAWGVVYTYTPELYPTRLRGTGTGWAAAVGRIAAFVAPLTIAYQISIFDSDWTVFLVFAVVMVAGALAVMILGPETKGLSLED